MFLTPETQSLINNHAELIEANLKNWIELELKTKKLSSAIEVRKLKFQQSIKPYLETYGRDVCNEFYTYWTEPTQSQKKLRFELEKTWEVGRRLARWKKNVDEKKPNYSNNGHVPQSVFPINRQEGTNNQHILDQLYPKAHQ